MHVIRKGQIRQERIANELKLKLGIRVSPRTVANYLRHGPGRKPDPKQRWMTFVRNHAKAIVACDFFVVVTANFRILYFFVIMQLGTRRILHHNVTDHPTAEWTLQQFREALPDDHPYRFVIHDRGGRCPGSGSPTLYRSQNGTIQHGRRGCMVEAYLPSSRERLDCEILKSFLRFRSHILGVSRSSVFTVRRHIWGRSIAGRSRDRRRQGERCMHTKYHRHG
jgi:hypothetical protein